MKYDIIEKAGVQIEDDEGFRNFIYDDSLGVKTEGIGFKVIDLSDEEKAILASGITLENCLKVLNIKLNRIYDNLDTSISFFTSLPDNCQIGLLDLAYQIGVSGLLKYHKTLAYLEEGNYNSAGDELLNSLEARQTPNRAKHISNLIKSV